MSPLAEKATRACKSESGGRLRRLKGVATQRPALLERKILQHGVCQRRSRAGVRIGFFAVCSGLAVYLRKLTLYGVWVGTGGSAVDRADDSWVEVHCRNHPSLYLSAQRSSDVPDFCRVAQLEQKRIQPTGQSKPNGRGLQMCTPSSLCCCTAPRPQACAFAARPFGGLLFEDLDAPSYFFSHNTCAAVAAGRSDEGHVLRLRLTCGLVASGG